MNLFATACGAPAVRLSVSYRLTFAVALLLEAQGRLFRQAKAPLITRYATWLLGRNLVYSTEKARRELGWRPSLSYAESIDRTVRWFLSDPARGVRPGA
jgi:nucleoside-diphosphate-sugar epimerase